MDCRSTPTHADADGNSPRLNAPLWIVLGALALTAVLYWPTSVELARRWGRWTEPYAHGWLVVAASIWLIWRDRKHLAQIPLNPPPAGWLLVAIGSLAWYVGHSAGSISATMLMPPMLILLAIWTAGGTALARRVALPLLLLYVAVPIWEEILSSYLQWMTAEVTGWLTGMVGIPVSIQQYVIHIPAGSFVIEGGCSGINYFVTAVFIAVLLGEIDRDDLHSRVLLVVIAAALAIVTNWVRVFVVIVAGHLTDMQHYLVKVDHYKFGWALFAAALVFYFCLASRLPRRGRGSSAVKLQAVTSRGRSARAVGLTAVGLALGPARLAAQVLTVAPALSAAVPPVIAGWSGPERYISVWKPVFANADEEFLVSYVDANQREVAAYRAAYRSQREGKELRGYDNSAAGKEYRAGSSVQRLVLLPSGSIEVTEQVLDGRDDQDMLVWLLYAVDGRPDRMGLKGKLVYGLKSLLHPPTASIVALAAECRPDCSAARTSLEAIAPAAMPALLGGASSPDSSVN